MIKLVFALCTLLPISSVAGGGSDISGGGGGIKKNGKVYLTDLFEQGIEENVYFKSTSPNPEILQVLLQQTGLQKFSLEVVERIAVKIHELESLDPILASVLLEGMRTTQWSFTESSLQETNDTKPCVVKEKPVQIAVRQGQVVLINSALFKKMPIAHQAALVFHETISSFLDPRLTCQNRRVIGNFFTKEFFQNIEHAHELIKKLPSLFAALNEKGYGNKSLEWQAYTDLTLRYYTDSRLKQQYLFFPVLELLWEGKGNPENGGKEPSQIDLAVPTNYDLNKLCTAQQSGSQLMQILLKFSRVEVFPVSSDQQVFLPRLDWKLEPIVYDVVMFEAHPANTKALCTVESKDGLARIVDLRHKLKLIFSK